MLAANKFGSLDINMDKSLQLGKKTGKNEVDKKRACRENGEHKNHEKKQFKNSCVPRRCKGWMAC